MQLHERVPAKESFKKLNFIKNLKTIKSNLRTNVALDITQMQKLNETAGPIDTSIRKSTRPAYVKEAQKQQGFLDVLTKLKKRVEMIKEDKDRNLETYSKMLIESV